MTATVFDPNHLLHLDYGQMHGGALPAYQAEGIAAMVAVGRTLNADPPGAGKTVQMAGLIAAYVELGVVTHERPALVFTNGEAVAVQTARELARFTVDIDVVSLADHRGLRSAASAQERAESLSTPAHVKVMTYTQARTRMAGWAGELPPVVILDEVQALKAGLRNYDAVEEWLRPDVQRIHLFSATPYENEPRELYRIYDLLGPIEGMPTQAVFDQGFVEWTRRGPAKPIGWKSDREAVAFGRIVRPHTVQRSPEVVAASGLPRPAVSEEFTWVQLPAEQVAALASAGRARGQRRRRHDAQEGVIVGRTAGESVRATRAAQLVEELLGYDPTTKVLVIAQHLPELDTVGRLLAAAGVPYVEMRGATKERDDLVDSFRASTGVRVFLGSSVAEVGLNLQMCEHLVSVGIPDTWARLQQRIGRIARPGSAYDEVVHHVILTYTEFDIAAVNRVNRKATHAAMVAAA